MRALVAIPHLSSFVLILAIGLVLVAPLLQGETLCTDDGALHVYRTVALDRAIRDGLLYPRWFPDLAYGYGFPFFVYREPLGYYAMEVLHLIGVSIPNAFNLVLAGSVMLSGLAMFLLARDIFGVRGGLLSAVVYMAAPYTLIGSLTRGNLPEVTAFAWMPLILFFFRRLIVLGQTRYFVAAVVSYSALFLTHNISSLLFAPLLAVYVALLGWVRARGQEAREAGKRQGISRSTLHALLAIVLAFGLTAFFWFPALAEQDQAQLYLTHATRGNDYHYNFIDLGELLSGPGQSDPSLLNPPLRIFFGWPQVALAAIGAATLLKARVRAGDSESRREDAAEESSHREQRATIIAAAIAVVALTFMALPAALPLWDSLPLIRFVQFPWRFVGRALLPAALLAAAMVPHHEDTKTQRKLSVFVPLWLMVCLVFTAPLSYPRVCPTPHDLTMTDVFAYERLTGHIGVDPLGAYLPGTVIERPTGSPLEAQYAAGKIIERFDAAALPGGARLSEATYAPNRADLTVSTPTAFTATYLAFAFPGWRVSIDNQPVAIRASDPAGLITFDVPAGEHHIHVEFGDSPQRALANGLSLIALIVAATVTLVIRHASRFTLHASRSTLHAPRSTLHAPRSTLHALLALVAFLLVKALLIDPGLTPLRAARLTGESLSGVSHPLDVTFGDRLRLLGYEVTPSAARPGDIVRVDLYWQAVRPLDATYQAEAGLADADGWPWSPKHADRPRDYADAPITPLWPLDAYAIDSFEFEVLPGTPPGEYALVVQLFDRATLAPLQPSIVSIPGRRAAPIGTIPIERAARTFSAGQLRIYGGERLALDSDLTLLGYNIDRVDTVPGESVLLTFFWQAERAPQTDRVLRVELLNSSNEVLASQEMPIGGERYPTSQWTAGEQIVSLTTVRVPAAASSGEYLWRGTLVGASSFDMRPSFRVAAPERAFDAPQMQNRIDAGLGDFAALLGFDLASDRRSIDVTLYWQARAETATAYKAFVHVLNGEGRIVAQADAVPVNGTRPTTGWLPGEVIADRYGLSLAGDLPAGSYQIVAGLYDSDTGTRLKTGDGDEVIPLAVIHVP